VDAAWTPKTPVGVSPENESNLKLAAVKLSI
jgi:hypothetical protein